MPFKIGVKADIWEAAQRVMAIVIKSTHLGLPFCMCIFCLRIKDLEIELCHFCYMLNLIILGLV